MCGVYRVKNRVTSLEWDFGFLTSAGQNYRFPMHFLAAG